MTLINLFFRNEALDSQRSGIKNLANVSKNELDRKVDEIFTGLSKKSFFPKWIESAIANWRKTAISSSIKQRICEQEANKITGLLSDYYELINDKGFKNGAIVELPEKYRGELAEKYRGLLPDNKIQYIMKNPQRIADILIRYNVIEIKNGKVTLHFEHFENTKQVAKYLTETIDGELLLEKHGESYMQLRASNKNELLQKLSKDSERTGFFYQGKKELELMDKAFANRFIGGFSKEFLPGDYGMIFRAITHQLKVKGENWDNGITKDLINECVGRDDRRESAVLRQFAEMFVDEKFINEISIISQVKKENPKIFEEFGLRNSDFRLFNLIGKDFIAKLPKNPENKNNGENSVPLNQNPIIKEQVRSSLGSFDYLPKLIDDYTGSQKKKTEKLSVIGTADGDVAQARLDSSSRRMNAEFRALQKGLDLRSCQKITWTSDGEIVFQ